MIKKTAKIFSLPIVLGVLVIIFHFNIDQNLFTWIVEKLLIISTFITSLIAFPLFFTICKDEELSIYESFKKAKPQMYSFWKSALLLLTVILGYFSFFFLIFYFLLIAPKSGSYYESPDLIDYLLTFFFPYLLAISFGIKYIFTPLISLFEEKSSFASLSISRKRIDSERKFNFAFFLILFSISSSFLFRSVGYFYPSLTFLISISYLGNAVFLIIFSYFVFKNYQKLKEENEDLNTKFKKTLTFATFLLGIPALLFFLYLSFAISFLDYDPEFSGIKSKELEIEITEPKREGNLYYLFKKEGIIGGKKEGEVCANFEVNDPDLDNYIQFIKENPEEAVNISKKNRKALDCFLKFANKNHYNSPPVFGVEMANNDNFMNPGEIFKFSRVNSFEITRLTEEGKDEEALKRFLAGAKLAKLITDQQSGPQIHDFLIGIGVKAINHNNTYKNINLSNISDQQLLEAIQKMDSLEIPKAAFERAFKLEYMFTESLIDNPGEIIKIMKDMESSVNPYTEEVLSAPSYFYKPNETKRNFLGLYKKMINNSKKELPLSGKAFLSFDRASLAAGIEYEIPFAIRLAYTLPKPIGEYVVKSASGNWIGMLLNDAFLLTISPSRQYEQLQDSQTYHRLQQLNLAIELYRREHGGLPDSLEQLSPDYISQIPEDPFDEGKKLQYSKDEGIIYSTKIDEVSEDERENYLIHLD